MVERTDDHPVAGSATYCSAVSLRQASTTLVLAQRSYANNATISSCMRISSGLGQRHCRYCLPDTQISSTHFAHRVPTRVAPVRLGFTLFENGLRDVGKVKRA